MKTILVYASLTALATALVACSSDEVVSRADNADEQEVCFTTSVDAATSRASAIDNNAKLAEGGFWVKAIKADGVSYPWGVTGTLKFTSTDNGQNFNAVVPDGSSFTANWPTGQLLYFYASSLDPDSVAMTLEYPPKYTIKPNPLVRYQKDFIYAANRGTRADFAGTNGKVPLNFRHALCQIEVKAKNTNTAYRVKVKGYKIHFMWRQATFTFPVTNVASVVASTVNGEWSDYGNSTEGTVADYYSGFYKGYTTADNSIYDTDGNYILLDGEERTIKSDVDDGLAMVLPTGGNISHYGFGSGFDGFAIGLLVQIDYLNPDGTVQSPLYPACQQGSMTKRISYSGLPRYYGYIFDNSIDANFEAGKKYTFLFDFSNGLGKVDFAKPDVVDPTSGTYNAADGTDTATSDAVDPYNGSIPTSVVNVLGSGMTVSLNIGGWTPEDTDRPTPVQ